MSCSISEERKNIDIGSCYSDFSLFREKTAGSLPYVYGKV